MVLNVNEISSLNDKKLIIPVFNDLIQIMNQRPKTLKAKDSVAAFRIRKNMEIGVILTLRNNDKLSFFIKKLQVCLALLSLLPSKSQFGINNISPLSLSPSSPSSPLLGPGANFTLLFSAPSSFTFTPSLHLRRLGLPTTPFLTILQKVRESYQEARRQPGIRPLSANLRNWR
jgi:hypothetical protein